jgi:hypothetical protein
MRGNAKALKGNNREPNGILIGPSMAPRFFVLVKFLHRGFLAHYRKSLSENDACTAI